MLAMSGSGNLNPIRISYAFIVLMIVLVAWLHLATPLLTVLFSYFALQKLSFGGRKTVAIILFSLMVLALTYGLAFFFHRSLEVFPKIASHTIPSVIEYAKQHDVELPFTDWDGLKTMALDEVMSRAKSVGTFAKGAGREFVMLIIGLVVATSLFVNARMVLEETPGRKNLYRAACEQIALRFASFYNSFAVVMGAQIAISAINTSLTSIFVFAVNLPYAGIIVVATFLCGLLPIIGNLMSNTIIVGIGFTVSPKMAVMALVFLVVLHKLEYFLNSKIIGDRIKNPVWMTLLGLVLGERLMGIPGMILAPVVLYWLKVETSQLPAGEEQNTMTEPERISVVK